MTQTPASNGQPDKSLRMMGDKVLIVPSDENGERATRGGLVIPATANSDRRLRWGKVVTVGPNTRHIEEGDEVLYAPDTGYDVEIDGVPYLILRERDIHATSLVAQTENLGHYL